MAAEYSLGTQSLPCTTCYIATDHLGSTRMVTDQNANVVGRHDYLPFGEEIAANTGGCNSTFGTSDFVNQKFTGQERDSETGLDFFQARYFSAALGRFNSPDPENAGASLFNPQSWNGYAYANNNPMVNIDPSGLSCINGQGTIVQESDGAAQADNGDGKGCLTVGVKLGDPNDPNTLNDGQVNARVMGEQTSLWDYLWTISTNTIPRYVENDVPLSNNAQQIVTRVGNVLPTVCGGGAYLYAGKELDVGGVNGFAGGITEFDSRAGVGKGALFESGGGEGVVGGGGYVATSDSKGHASGSGLAYLGSGVHAVAAGASIGVVGFSSGVGVYAEVSLFGRAAGVGIYANIRTNSACESSQQ
jgi:RHS repeat-associated protein